MAAKVSDQDPGRSIATPILVPQAGDAAGFQEFRPDGSQETGSFELWDGADRARVETGGGPGIRARRSELFAAWDCYDVLHCNTML